MRGRLTCLTWTLEAIQNIVFERLEKEGLEKVLLPLGTLDESQTHVPIFATPNLKEKTRVVVIFGEPCQNLGNLALRIANGPGGIDKGTMVSVVRDLHAQQSSPDDPRAPGILLANVGSVFWWPEGRKALTLAAVADMPLPSMVHDGRRITAENRIPGSETPEKHVEYILNRVVPALASTEARIDLIGIGDSSDMLVNFYDQEEVWAQWGHRVNTLSLLEGVVSERPIGCGEFKSFLKKVCSYLPYSSVLPESMVRRRGDMLTAMSSALGVTFSRRNPEERLSMAAAAMIRLVPASPCIPSVS